MLLGAFAKSKHPLPVKAAMGAGAVTVVELLAGLLVNRDYSVWDYRMMPLNFRGQVCLPFSLLWLPVSVGGMLLYKVMDNRLQQHISTAPWPAAAEGQGAAWGQRQLW